jgi:hypothetical protein
MNPPQNLRTRSGLGEARHFSTSRRRPGTFTKQVVQVARLELRCPRLVELLGLLAKRTTAPGKQHRPNSTTAEHRGKRVSKSCLTSPVSGMASVAQIDTVPGARLRGDDRGRSPSHLSRPCGLNSVVPGRPQVGDKWHKEQRPRERFTDQAQPWQNAKASLARFPAQQPSPCMKSVREGLSRKRAQLSAPVRSPDRPQTPVSATSCCSGNWHCRCR